MKVRPFLFTAALLFSHTFLFSQMFFYVSDGSNPFINKGRSLSPDSLAFVNASGSKGIQEVSWRMTNSSGIFDILIYPNPASTALSVALNSNNLHFKQLSIYSAGGKLVSQEAWGDASHYLINIIDLASGSYQVMACLSDGTVSFKSFFKR